MMRSRSGRESHRRDGARSKCARSLCIPCPSLMETSPATLSAQVELCMADLEQGLIEKIYREESGRILATLIRPLGDFDLAEEAAQEAFAAALEQWPRQSIPGIHVPGWSPLRGTRPWTCGGATPVSKTSRRNSTGSRTSPSMLRPFRPPSSL